jgi:hypothetical protein
MKDFYGAFAGMVQDTGIQGVINPAGLQRILISAIDQLADYPDLIIDQPGLPQELVKNMLKKVGKVNRLDAESLGTAVVDGALTAIAENPTLLIDGGGELECAFADVAGDFAANIASKVCERSISNIQGVHLIAAGTEAIAANPQLFTVLESQLSGLIVEQILKITAEDSNNLIAGASLVSLTEAVLRVTAARGTGLLAGGSAPALADRIGAVIQSALERSAKELGRQIDLPSIPLVVSEIVDAWARGELESIDPDDALFKELFTQLAERHTRLAA